MVAVAICILALTSSLSFMVLIKNLEDVVKQMKRRNDLYEESLKSSDNPVDN